MRRTHKFVLVTAAATLVIGALGGLLVEAADRGAVWMGAGVAMAAQLVLFYAFFVVAFSSRPLLAHGMGMLGRLVVVGTAALFWVPWAGVAAAPLLFSLVAVLFVTTLAEPLLLIGVSNDR